ncbi:MAG: ABC-2 type transporter [Bacillota bacterium]
MIEDIRTMAWKEFRELAAMQGSLKGGIIRYGITFGILGIYLPLNFGRSFVEMPYFLFIYVWAMMFMGIGIVLDSFAGERERHTLETLLASRLSDRAILYGKISAAVIYGFAMTLALIALGLATVNVAFWNGQISLFPPEFFAFALGAALLTNVFFTALGVLVSLRAPTVRQGSETLMVAVIAIAVIPFVLYFILTDELKAKLLDAIITAGIINLGIGVIFVLIAMCAIALYAATLRFRRDRLILD